MPLVLVLLMGCEGAEPDSEAALYARLRERRAEVAALNRACSIVEGLTKSAHPLLDGKSAKITTELVNHVRIR